MSFVQNVYKDQVTLALYYFIYINNYTFVYAE